MKRMSINVNEELLQKVRKYLGDKSPSDIVNQALQELVWRCAGEAFFKIEGIEIWPDYAETYRQDHTDEEWGDIGWGARRPMVVNDLPMEDDRGSKRRGPG
jgi:Bacterial antitoxin of type II TA system, VapB